MGLTFSAATHRYRLDGKPIPGVTSIIKKGLPNQALMFWAAKIVAEKAVTDASSITSRLENGCTPDELISELKSTPWVQRDQAGIRGTDIHSYAQALICDGDVDVPAEHAHIVQAVADLLDEQGITPISAEAQLASRTHWYAGTSDLIATTPDGKTVLWDWKTSRGVHGSYFLQLAAYAKADFYLDAEGKETSMPPISEIAVVHLTDDGARLIPGPDIDTAFTAFVKVKQVADTVKTIDSWGEDK